MSAPSVIASSSRPLTKLLRGASRLPAQACSASRPNTYVASAVAGPSRHRTFTSTSPRKRPPHHPTQPLKAPATEAEPAVVKSPSSPNNPAAWPGLQKPAGSNGSSGKSSPFANLGSGLDKESHGSPPISKDGKADSSTTASSTSTKQTTAQQGDAACATLSPSSPAAPRSQSNGKARDTSEAPKATAPEESKASPKPAARPAKAFRAKKEALTLTPTAVERLQELLESDSGPRLIRIGVRNKGCAGMSYHLEYVTPEQAGKFDERVKQDGVEVLIDSKALFSIIGSVMDWQEDRLSAKFVFNNPNVTSECGCGESFMT